ncbi:DUF4276 family protein [Pontiellaceae bacterium B1224]|nr:DUF4276 family protein [Pontiellaceae bacterium B1224]
MHFEFLVEGQTELTTLSILMKKILGEYQEPHSWKIHKHRGIGKIPDDPASTPNRHDQTLLHNLPSKLRAYGKEDRKDVVVVVLADLDDRPNCIAFKQEMLSLLNDCPSKPITLFRIAIEELEAWFLGDRPALMQAYPEGNFSVFSQYKQDSQCGTWEILAELIHEGGLSTLVAKGKRSVRVLEQKRKWAATIAPLMDIEANQSPSFCAFRDGIIKYAVR